VVVARSKNGKAISSRRRTPAALSKLKGLRERARSGGDLKTWRRVQAVVGYIEGRTVIALSAELDVTRGSINRWLQWYAAAGLEGLKPRKAAGPAPRMAEPALEELATIIEGGPQAAGFSTGIWTGPMIGALIRERFGVSYHNHHVPRLLHRLGFSVQRPRKRLARADAEAQALWLRKRFPAIKKKPPPVGAS
jgi:transposase